MDCGLPNSKFKTVLKLPNKLYLVNVYQDEV